MDSLSLSFSKPALNAFLGPGISVIQNTLLYDRMQCINVTNKRNVPYVPYVTYKINYFLRTYIKY